MATVGAAGHGLKGAKIVQYTQVSRSIPSPQRLTTDAEEKKGRKELDYMTDLDTLLKLPRDKGLVAPLIFLNTAIEDVISDDSIHYTDDLRLGAGIFPRCQNDGSGGIEEWVLTYFLFVYPGQTKMVKIVYTF